MKQISSGERVEGVDAPVNPFRRRTVEERTLLDRAFGRSRPSAASAALQNLFATTPIDQVHRAHVGRIFDQERVILRERRELSASLWRSALEAFAEDARITDSEAEFLDRLRSLLEIEEADVIKAESEILYPRYRALVKSVLADRTVTPEERLELDRLAKHLRLSPMIASEMFSKSAGELLSRVLSDALADRRLSPEEFREYAAVAQAIGITPTHDHATEQMMHRCALLWRIEQGELPIVPASFALQRGEVCHLSIAASWHEIRKQSVRLGYTGFSTSIPIVKGVRYRIGTYAPVRISRDVLTQIDTGTLHVTNKRILFDGAAKNSGGPLLGAPGNHPVH